jgi:hypothetical protein
VPAFGYQDALGPRTPSAGMSRRSSR